MPVNRGITEENIQDLEISFILKEFISLIFAFWLRNSLHITISTYTSLKAIVIILEFTNQATYSSTTLNADV